MNSDFKTYVSLQSQRNRHRKKVEATLVALIGAASFGMVASEADYWVRIPAFLLCSIGGLVVAYEGYQSWKKVKSLQHQINVLENKVLAEPAQNTIGNKPTYS